MTHLNLLVADWQVIGYHSSLLLLACVVTLLFICKIIRHTVYFTLIMNNDGNAVEVGIVLLY